MNNIVKHNSLAIEEILKIIGNKNNINIADCTFGCGYHTNAISKAYPDCNIYSFDYDKNNIDKYKKQLTNVNYFHLNFSNLYNFCNKNNVKFDVIIIDLGVHQEQIFDNKYGLSYTVDQELNMKVNNLDNNLQTLKEFISKASIDNIYNIIKYFGEDKNAKKIANNIFYYKKIYKINTTKDLISAIFYKNLKYSTKTSARVFQAFRIYINKEINNLILFFKNIDKCIPKESILITLTFHSIEDRIIKNFMNNKKLSFGKDNLFKFLNLKEDFNYNLKNSKLYKKVFNGYQLANRKDLFFIIRGIRINENVSGNLLY